MGFEPYTVLLHLHKKISSRGCKQLPDLDVNQSLSAQDAFRPIPGLISCTGVTRRVGVTCRAHAAQRAGLRSLQMLAATGRASPLHLRHHNSERLHLPHCYGNFSRARIACDNDASRETTWILHQVAILICTCIYIYIYIYIYVCIWTSINSCYEASSVFPLFIVNLFHQLMHTCSLLISFFCHCLHVYL